MDVWRPARWTQFRSMGRAFGKLRPLRIEWPGAWYNVTARAVARSPVFFPGCGHRGVDEKSGGNPEGLKRRTSTGSALAGVRSHRAAGL